MLSLRFILSITHLESKKILMTKTMFMLTEWMRYLIIVVFTMIALIIITSFSWSWFDFIDIHINFSIENIVFFFFFASIWYDTYLDKIDSNHMLSFYVLHIIYIKNIFCHLYYRFFIYSFILFSSNFYRNNLIVNDIKFWHTSRFLIVYAQNNNSRIFWISETEWSCWTKNRWNDDSNRYKNEMKSFNLFEKD